MANELEETDEEISMWEDMLNWRANNIIKTTCCGAKEEPMLCTKQGSNPTKLIHHKFTHGYCEKYGVDKLLRVMEFPDLSQREETVTTMEWKLKHRQGVKIKGKDKGKQNTRLELDETEMFMFELVEKIKEKLDLCRKHYTESTWMNIMKSTDTDTIPDDELLVFIDFSATVYLQARLTDNDYVDNDAFLEIFAVIHCLRELTVNKDGESISDTVCHCDVLYFLGLLYPKEKRTIMCFTMHA